VNTGNDSGVDKVDECIIYESTVNRAEVEDGEISVFNTRGVEVRVGISASMQSHPIYRVPLLATSLDHHTISD
jgi:hypothetical protein